MLDNKEYLDKIYQKYNNKNRKRNQFYNTQIVQKGTLNILKVACTLVLTIGITAGVVYASIITYNKIMKDPEYYTMEDEKITKEDILNSMNIDVAKEKAKVILDKFGITKGNFEDMELTKNARVSEIYWTINGDGYELEINAITGELFSFFDNVFDDTKIKSTANKQKATDVANKIFANLEYSREYKLANIEKHTITDDTCLWQASFCIEYDGVYNYYQQVKILFVPEVEKLKSVVYFDYQFENNPIVISREQALDIVKQKNNYTDTIEMDVKLEIRELNYSYQEDLNKEYPVNEEQEIDNYLENMKFIKNSKIIRKIWYVTDYTEGKQVYYIDCTTGEIIGGEQYGLLETFTINNAFYSPVYKQRLDTIYNKTIVKEDLGNEIATIKEYNEKFKNVKVYEFLPGNARSLVAVDLNGKYKLLSFDSFSNQSKNTLKNLFEVYNIKNENDVSKIEFVNPNIQEKREGNAIIQVSDDIVTTNTDKEIINTVIEFIFNLKEISQDAYIKDIQKYYKKDYTGPSDNYRDVNVYSNNNTYMYFTYYPVSKYIESYSKYYKLTETQNEFIQKLCGLSE